MSIKLGNSNYLGSPDVIVWSIDGDDDNLVGLNYIKQVTKNRWGLNRPQEEQESEFNKFVKFWCQ